MEVIKRRLFLILKSIIIWPPYMLSYCMPRKKYLWIFGSFRDTFIDNSKYLFINSIKLDQKFPPIIPVWITPSKQLAQKMRVDGYKSYWKYSLYGLYICLRAEVYIYSWTVKDINFWLSGGAIRVNLWHGIPLKKIGLDIYGKKDTLKNRAKTFFYQIFYPDEYVIPDYFLTTRSTEISKIFKKAYPSKNYLNSVYPRIEHFILSARKSVIDSIATDNEKKIIMHIQKYDHALIYMPTFRDNKEDDEKLGSNEVLDLVILNDILKGTNTLFLIKLHVNALKSLRDKHEYSNIIFIDPSMDVYILLPHTTGLVTDYSSVFFDYILLNKPILFYNFDMEVYNNNSRQFYFPYAEIACGPIMVNFNELCEQLKNSEYLNYPYDFDKLIARIWGNIDQPFLLDHLTSILYKDK